MKRFFFFLLACLVIPFGADAASSSPRPGEGMLAEYFAIETGKLAEACLGEIKTKEDWDLNKGRYRKELFEMLSLSPLPERGDLKAVVTGKVEHEEFTVEKVHFQSLPRFYVTGNLYIPKGLKEPAPTILYVCGHGPVVKNGISYGNKVSYQHHGAWFARNGYVAFLIDTVQMGEIQGIHHGTYREGMWWWNSRGYSSAGAEAWNVIRALDYLETRKEVNSNRFGITGRSGGGAYSWWGAALDDRIKVAAPVAGIADLRNHIIDGTVEGHCDCMFVVNTYRWDYGQLAALVAPRPLLIANTDKDSIFPLDGVMRVHSHVRRIYDLHEAGRNLGVLITEGPHKDTQDLQVPVFRWFNKHLKGEDPVIEMAAVKFFEPEQLRVFDKLPSDERSSKIHETFVPKAAAASKSDLVSGWDGIRKDWMVQLESKVFRGWPTEPGPLKVRVQSSRTESGILLESCEFNSQPAVPLTFYLFSTGGAAKPARIRVRVLDDGGFGEWGERMAVAFSGEKDYEALREGAVKRIQQELSRAGGQVAFVMPRGIGPTMWSQDRRKKIQIRRRFMLLGQTVDGMQVWDIRRAVQALRELKDDKNLPVELVGEGNMACNVLYASLFESSVERLELRGLPSSHRTGPDYLNVLRFLDVPQALAMAVERSKVTLHAPGEGDWEFLGTVREALGWDAERLVVDGAE